MTDEDDSGGGGWGKNCSMTTATGLIYRQSSNQIYREQLIQGQGTCSIGYPSNLHIG
jgi:hypothetical protein